MVKDPSALITYKGKPVTPRGVNQIWMSLLGAGLAFGTVLVVLAFIFVL